MAGALCLVRRGRQPHRRRPTYKNVGATRRAEKRRANCRDAKAKTQNISETTVVAKPTFDEDVKLFKTIVRQTMRHDADPKIAKWFQADARARLKRVGKLGVAGHQPALAVYCMIAKNEKALITKAILQQKIGNNPKAEKTMPSMHAESSTRPQPQAKRSSSNMRGWPRALRSDGKGC